MTGYRLVFIPHMSKSRTGSYKDKILLFEYYSTQSKKVPYSPMYLNFPILVLSGNTETSNAFIIIPILKNKFHD